MKNTINIEPFLRQRNYIVLHNYFHGELGRVIS